MSVVPVLRPGDVIRAFERLGWEVVRRRGSHIILTKQGSIATLSVPDQTEVARGTLRAPNARAGLTEAKFLAAVSGQR